MVVFFRIREVVLTDYGTLLRDHVSLRYRSIDRFFLQAYVPMLQSVGEVCIFLRLATEVPGSFLSGIWQDG